MNTAAHVAAGMLMTVLLAGIAPGQEQPAFPPLRMEAVGLAGVSFEAAKGQWTVVNLGQGPKTVWVDQSGQLIEHRLVSWELGVPTETMISGGQLFVRHGGRVYRSAGHQSTQHGSRQCYTASSRAFCNVALHPN
jgi:hypothetical protein